MSLKQAYSKVRRRIQNQLYRMRKRGFDTSNVKLPKIPKKITAGSIRRLEKQFATKKLYEKTTYTEPSTGRQMSGKKGLALRRQQGADKRRKPQTTTVEIPGKTGVEKTFETTVSPFEPDETEYELEQTEIPSDYVDIDTEYNIMVEQVENLIQDMYSCKIPTYAKACASAASADFQNWLSGRSKEEVVAALREWDMLELSQRFFDSDDANVYGHQHIVAQHLAQISETVASDLQDIIDESEEWVEAESNGFYDVFFNQ